MKGDEQRYSRYGRSAGTPTRWQKASRLVDTLVANQWSYACAPVTVTWSGEAPCSSTASVRCSSFQTTTRSGISWMTPLVVR